jgi:hypothetical protein
VAKVIISFLLPALAGLIAAAAQFALTSWLPGLQHLAIRPVTLDSYIAVVLLGVLCALAGHWVGRNANTRGGVVAVAVVPTAWCALVLVAAFRGGDPSDRLQSLTMFEIAAAATPLIGIAVGWTVSARTRPKPR